MSVGRPRVSRKDTRQKEGLTSARGDRNAIGKVEHLEKRRNAERHN